MKFDTYLVGGGSGRQAGIELGDALSVYVSLYPHNHPRSGHATLLVTSVQQAEALMRAAAHAIHLLDPSTPLREAAPVTAEERLALQGKSSAQGTAAANVVPASPSSSGVEPSKDATAGTGTAGAGCCDWGREL